MKNCYGKAGMTLLLLSMAFSSFSQEVDTVATRTKMIKVDTIVQKPWGNEAVLALSYANGGMAFGLFYKRQVAAKRYFRISLADVGFYRRQYTPYHSNQFPRSQLSTNLNLTMGVEWRFKLHKLVSAYTGLDILAGASFYASEIQDPSVAQNEKVNTDYTVRAGLAFNSGILVHVHEVISIGFNLSPDVYFQYSPYELTDALGNEYKGEDWSVLSSFSSSSVQLTAVFHWAKKPYRLKRTRVRITP